MCRSYFARACRWELFPKMNKPAGPNKAVGRKKIPKRNGHDAMA